MNLKKKYTRLVIFEYILFAIIILLHHNQDKLKKANEVASLLFLASAINMVVLYRINDQIKTLKMEKSVRGYYDYLAYREDGDQLASHPVTRTETSDKGWIPFKECSNCQYYNHEYDGSFQTTILKCPVNPYGNQKNLDNCSDYSSRLL